MARAIRLGIVGLGKIARDQHLPAIVGNPAFELAATASPDGASANVPAYAALSDMIATGGLDAVAICTPPAARHALACEAIAAGLHVFLEKPPAATLNEARDLIDRAAAQGITLFAAWHSREAAGVADAAAWVAQRNVDAIRIEWKEDIRRWHPGQEWILGPGGFGVFDPAINALSILTRIVPDAIFVERSVLTIPLGRAAPIAATIDMRSRRGPIHAKLDFLQTGPQTWSITITADQDRLVLADGGARLTVDGHESLGENREYPRLYARFAELIATGASDVDLRPLELVADAFLIADHRIGEAFAF